MQNPQADFYPVRFEEAGSQFEIFAPMPDGTFWMNVTDEQGTLHGFVEQDFKAVCKAVDQWLALNTAPDDPRRFKGLRLTTWDHETNLIVTRSYGSRGELLAWFDDGAMPTLDEIIELAECPGDRLLIIEDGGGTLLLDRRDVVMAKMSNAVLVGFSQRISDLKRTLS